MIKQHELTGTNGSDIKFHNLRAVLLALLQQKTISRVRLARLTGLSNTTITHLVNELLAEGIIEEIGAEESPTAPTVGRPPTALRLIPTARYAVGVHFGVGSVRVAVTDLLAQPLLTLSLEHPLERPAEEVLEDTLALVRSAIAESGIRPTALVGVGVGASGLVDLERGVNLFAPNLGWRDVPLRDWFADALGVPVWVDNNVRAMALAAEVGLSMGIPIVMGVLAGDYLEKRWDLRGFGLAGLTLLGVLVGAANVYRLLKQASAAK